MESGILAAGTSVLNFALTGASFEVGALGGSMISAIPTGSRNTVTKSLLNVLMDYFEPESNAAELACGW